VTPRAAQEGEAMPNRDPEARTQDDVREMLREHGLRFSRPRAAILGFFAEEDRHVSAEDLYVELKRRGEHLSLSTVYLNLHVLSDAGVVREFQGSEGQRLYDSNVTPHYHLICRETGEVRDVPAPTVDGVPLGRFLKQTIEAATGWQVDEPQVQLRGRSPRARRDGPEGDTG
jgi:Fe2+ or Zn2+ uptake regulation protein